jgi:hypothetical protein
VHEAASDVDGNLVRPFRPEGPIDALEVDRVDDVPGVACSELPVSPSQRLAREV